MAKRAGKKEQDASASVSSKSLKKKANKASGKSPKPAPAATSGKPARPSALLDTRVIYCGDCLDQLKKIPDHCVDLIYIDPPFNSNRNYEVFWGETKEKRSFADRHASTKAYIDYMRPRCAQLARVLKKTGSFYYHCDWHASHYVKVMLDQTFGENNFQNEIVWRRTNAKGLASKGFPNNHDTIFYYTGGGRTYTWNRPFKEYDLDYIDKFYNHVEKETGRRYTLGDLTNPNRDRPNLTYEWNGIKRVWRWTRERMEEAEKNGLLQYTKTGLPRQKRYLDEMQGQPVDTVWEDIPPIPAHSAERLGYPTQKPLALLERIIRASSNENDIVLDGFCGCGTALVAAQNLGRQWIGIDISPTACRVMAKRLRDVCYLREDENLWRSGRGFVVRELPYNEKQLRAMPPFEFENWAINALGGQTNIAQVGDMGIDGRIFPAGSKPESEAKDKKTRTGATGQSMFMDDWYPIQVKQKDKAGRPDIDSFEAVMVREERAKGFFVSFDYTSDALTEVDRFFRQTGKIIVALTVKQILEEQLAQKLA